MHISILTLFPQMFDGPFDYSILSRAKKKGLVTVSLIDIRDFATGPYKSVDDHPYGGGAGMIMRVDVLDRSLTFAKGGDVASRENTCAVLLDPKGTIYTQEEARKLSRAERLILVCGHYEGVDERVTGLVDKVISIGRFVLTGGEPAAMVVVDSVVRLLPGVLSKAGATREESHTMRDPEQPEKTLLEYPQYTKPIEYKRMKVPEILLSGNHQKIKAWRLSEARKQTKLAATLSSASVQST